MNVQGRKLHLEAYEAIVTGFDGVLLDTRLETGGTIHGQSGRVALKRVSRLYGVPELDAITSEQNQQTFDELPTLTVEGAFWRLLQLAGIVNPGAVYDTQHGVMQKLLEVKTEAYRDLIVDKGRPVEGAQEFFLSCLPRMKGKLAIASASRKRDTLPFFRWHLPSGIFYDDNIFEIESPHSPKQRREVFERAMASVGITDTLVQPVLAIVHDPQDIRSARDAGASYVLGVTTRFTQEELMAQYDKPDGTIRDFRDLLSSVE